MGSARTEPSGSSCAHGMELRLIRSFTAMVKRPIRLMVHILPTYTVSVPRCSEVHLSTCAPHRAGVGKRRNRPSQTREHDHVRARHAEDVGGFHGLARVVPHGEPHCARGIAHQELVEVPILGLGGRFYWRIRQVESQWGQSHRQPEGLAGNDAPLTTTMNWTCKFFMPVRSSITGVSGTDPPAAELVEGAPAAAGGWAATAGEAAAMV